MLPFGQCLLGNTSEETLMIIMNQGGLNLFQRQMPIGNFEVNRGPPFSLTGLNGDISSWLLWVLGPSVMLLCYVLPDWIVGQNTFQGSLKQPWKASQRKGDFERTYRNYCLKPFNVSLMVTCKALQIVPFFAGQFCLLTFLFHSSHT